MLTKLFNQFLKDVETLLEIAFDALHQRIFDYFDLEPGNHASFFRFYSITWFFSFSPNMRYFSKMLHLGIVFSSLTLVSVHGAWTRYRLVNGVFSYPNCSKGNFSQSTLTSKR
jgi:hypothetical protein